MIIVAAKFISQLGNHADCCHIFRLYFNNNTLEISLGSPILGSQHQHRSQQQNLTLTLTQTLTLFFFLGPSDRARSSHSFGNGTTATMIAG